MAYKSKATFWSETDAKFDSGTDKWEGLELDGSFQDLKDSVMWQDGEITLTDAATVTWDYTSGSEAVVTLTANRTLSITNLPTDRVVYGTLLKLGAFTLTLPTGENSSSGNVTGTGRTLITFRSRANGDIDFNFSTYSAT